MLDSDNESYHAEDMNFALYCVLGYERSQNSHHMKVYPASILVEPHDDMGYFYRNC